MTSRIVLSLVCLLGLASCADDTVGGGDGEDSAAVTSTTAGDTAVDDSAAAPTTATTSATAPTTSGAAPAPPPSANQRRRTDASGFALTFTVGGNLRYRADEDITLNLVVENVSKETLRYDSNDTQNFLITARDGGSGASWRSDDCRRQRRDDGFRAPALDLAPGEKVTFQTVYPVTRVPGSSEDGRSCRLPAGDYVAFGKIEWCPPGSIGDDGACDPARTKPVSAPGVPITIG